MPTFPAAFRNLAGEGAILLRKNRINPAVFRMFSIPRSQFPVGCGDFLIFPTVFSLFSGFPFYTYYNKEDFHYEHHYRHRPWLPVNVSSDRLPVTTKENPSFHGYGLQNVQTTLAKYHSVYAMDYADGWFEFATDLPNTLIS